MASEELRQVGTASVGFRFSQAPFCQLETSDFLQHLVGVSWPYAAACLDILVDDSLQLFLFKVIKHNNKINGYFKQAADFPALNRTFLSCSIPTSDVIVG